ncbi:hypothetical protein ACIHCX_31885 [Streptomyces sp. NPDC052043]|uniref:hypothetical protein n=1 Tax=Streptomyces sp. NPDC052043 TaxID=3365684 RepID=UPI0037D9328B
MSNSPSPRPATPPTVWPARGRHTGPAAEDVVRRHLKQLKADGVLHDHLEAEGTGPGGEKVFEARWLMPGEVTVRARLALAPLDDPGDAPGRAWTLLAEAERRWDPRWPSPATMFWPQGPDAGWQHEAVTGLPLGEATPLPDDDKDLRRVLRHVARDTWTLHVVVHEAMTPDERGRAAVVRLLPEGLRHRVVEHRAAPHRFRAVNWVLDDFGIRVPRGGAVVLPGSPAPSGYAMADFSVRSVFLDGTEPTELLDTVRRFAALPRPLPDGADRALAGVREEWRLLTVEEELAGARELVTMYSEALEAMTKSRDLYKEAAERAHEALAVYREAEAEGMLPARRQAGPVSESPFRQLARGLGRLKGTALSLRPGAAPERRPKAGAASDDGGASPAGGDAGTSPPAGGSEPRAEN